MDQIKIGKFIAECRKEENLTQAQLAEKLYVTDRAVSKWETGKSMPDSSIMLELCSILKISVNDLLLGEKTDSEKKNEKQEKFLLELTKEIEHKSKLIWISWWLINILNTIFVISSIYFVMSVIPEGVGQNIVLGIILVFFTIIVLFMVKLEASVGYYKCKNCGHEIVPTYSELMEAKHIGTVCYLKCPKCNKKAWHRKIIKK